MTNRELAHASTLSRRQLVRSLGATLLLPKRIDAAGCVLGANAMERDPGQPQRICNHAGAGQAEIDCQYRAEPNSGAVILFALIDRARRVEQHQPFAFAYHGEIRAQDDCLVG